MLINHMYCTGLEICSAARHVPYLESILLSKFSLIMHPSLPPRRLQPCFYPPLILPSVGQEPAATHCSLCSVSHIAAQLSLSVFLRATVSSSLSPCTILYSSFQAALTRRERAALFDLGLCEQRMEVCMHACAVTVCVAREN